MFILNSMIMDRKEIKLLLNHLENNPKHLTSLEHKFVVSLKKNYMSTGVMTKKDVESLHELKKYVMAPEEAEAVYASDDKYQAQYSSFDSGTTYSGPLW
jgi:hypothetical protein